MNFVFLMDPLETVKIGSDTTYAFMRAAFKRGGHVFYLVHNGITRRDGKTFFKAVEVRPMANKNDPFVRLKNLTLSEEKVDALFIRTDPPFNDAYLLNTWLLDLLPPSIVVINNPRAVRDVNEKIWASQFTALVPPTIISSSKAELLSFIKRHKDVIAKPTDGHGGKGVFHLKGGDTNVTVTLETLTSQFKKHIILQKFVSASRKGDKRILLLNGEPLGAVLRVHRRDEHRNNFYAGGHKKKTTITQRDKEIIRTLKPHLQEMGLYFVGIDILGDYLVEVNVTSPTCLQEMNRLYGKNLEKKVIVFVEELVAENKRLSKI